MIERKVLGNGTWVVCTSVDPYGFNGRELHPSADHVGFMGQIVDALIIDTSVSIKDYVYEPFANTPVHDNESVCYTVENPTGAQLELMDHEIEKLDDNPEA